jgi:hypothetical protein
MASRRTTARIFLLCARQAPVVVAIRRKPTRWFHILRWDTRTDQIEHGSWFYGRIYEKRCDLSPDGEWLVYFASAQHASDFPTWTGLCRPPWLKTVAESEGIGTWLGGGFWRDAHTLLVNGCGELTAPEGQEAERGLHLPFRIEGHQWNRDPGDLEVLSHRLDRDWQPDEAASAPRTLSKPSGNWSMRGVTWTWVRQPTPRHPALRATGPYGMQSGFRFELECHGGFLDGADWCDYDALGQLVFSREGALHRCEPNDVRQGKVTQRIELEQLTPPARSGTSAGTGKP